MKISDRLKKASINTKQSKSSRPVLKGQDELVDKVIKMKNDLENMERQYEQLESELTSTAFSLYSEVRTDGNYSSSIFAPGAATNGALIVYSDKFSNLPSESEEELRNLDSNYEKHFVEVRKLTVKKDAGKTISNKTVEKILAALGDEFENIFDVKVEIGTRPGFAEVWNEVPESVRAIVKQAKPSVRNVTEDQKAC